MFKRQHIYLLSCLLSALILLNSCEEIVEEILVGCNSYNYPVLVEKQLKDGKVNVFYSDHVWAEIKNDPQDDSDYNYHFNVSDGLPDGMNWFVEGRRVIFEGTPTESGSFGFMVEVWAEVNEEWLYTEDIPELCTEYASEGFTIYIGE
ncbi:MAG: hypothetical protein HKN00_04250 [Flavobacteriaceae bacterium]|nr:hypothetical protein [Bacteroidia bacterium]NNF74373.1 hypothetical protein [Flavobacteriaceae bacterium]